jgi:predicted unusual protein kinase regulating ubiquinone biosynthesis (AarF/ABC1/UbiB family)
MTAALLEHAQDLLVGIMPDLRQPEIRYFFAEYEDLLHNYPFQVHMDLLFMYRALSVVSTVVKQLDPDFDLSAAAAPMTKYLIVQAWQREWRGVAGAREARATAGDPSAPARSSGGSGAEGAQHKQLLSILGPCAS